MKSANQILTVVIAAGMLSLLSSCFPAVVAVRPAPPPPQTVIIERPVPPHPRAVWVEGEYVWNRRARAYVLVPGHWERPVRESAIWVPGHWQDRRGGSVWIPGYWR